MAIKTHVCAGHPRRAATGTVKWNGHAYTRMLFAHGALAQMQKARARYAANHA